MSPGYEQGSRRFPAKISSNGDGFLKRHVPRCVSETSPTIELRMAPQASGGG
eukprot:CAMPEP_0176308512 /NCGR_PEP_ID=MMETSP0121_2-20121125/64586_1 /TAXON_ID=160619 /ORGANISM="Kryptoperidinium foliaceum, Strain CCMP 1326" /LENGTH=51 /DNA_ID=CAMNT_0017650355 /DNA_START=244 /DNA_END=395 /DNA_ORIENTATION=-